MKLRKMFKVVAVVSVLMIVASSCNDCVRGEGEAVTRTLDIAGFSVINISGSTGVNISQGVEQRVEITAPQNIIDLLNTSVRDNTWDVSFEECIRARNIEINIITPSLTGISISGSGDVKSLNNLNVENLDVNISGSGNAELMVNARTVNTTVTGSGNVRFSGSSTTHMASIVGSGDIRADEFTTVRTNISVTGSGDARVNATELLEVNITGSGDVEYKDTGARILSDVKGSGELSRR